MEIIRTLTKGLICRIFQENSAPALSSRLESPVLSLKSNLLRSKENITQVEDSISKLALSNDRTTKESGSGEEILSELKNISGKLETLTKTVLYMEKRLTLVEDQVKLLSRDS